MPPLGFLQHPSQPVLLQPELRQAKQAGQGPKASRDRFSSHNHTTFARMLSAGANPPSAWNQIRTPYSCPTSASLKAFAVPLLQGKELPGTGEKYGNASDHQQRTPEHSIQFPIPAFYISTSWVRTRSPGEKPQVKSG